MAVGVAEALKIRPRVNIIVVLTDGATPWPTKKPVGSILYLAVLTTKTYEQYVPSWMTPVVIEE
jgi:hypothetical protein